MRIGAGGIRGEVLSPVEPGDLSVAVKSDAFRVRTTSDAVHAVPGRHNLAAADADVTRLRLPVEGSRGFETGSGTLTPTPTLDFGLRHDGGDAETGTGIELSTGLRYAGDGVTVEGSVRTLVAHETEGYEESGASGAMCIDPGASRQGSGLCSCRLGFGQSPDTTTHPTKRSERLHATRSPVVKCSQTFDQVHRIPQTKMKDEL